MSEIKKALKEVFPNEFKNDKKEKDDATYISYLETDKYILEEIKLGTKATCSNDEPKTTLTTLTTLTTDTKFILYDKQTGTSEIKDQFEHDGKIYKPIVDELVSTGTILLPSGIEEYGTDRELVEEIKKFLYANFEVKDYFNNFLPYLCMFYWVYEKFPFIPYIHFVGRTSTGKTTAMEVFGSICYKPIDASGSITMSPIFRTASRWGGTLLLDEFDSTGDSYHEMISFLKSGVSNRAVLRTEGDKTREVKVYLIKSPKIFTSENPVSDAGLQSRTIVVEMTKNKRKIPLYHLQKFMTEAEHIRNKLLLWRLRNLVKIDLSAIEFGFSELAIFDRRVQQVVTPIYYLSDEETKKEIIEFAKSQERETFRSRQESVDGLIFQAIVEKVSKGEPPTLAEIARIINSGNSDLHTQIKEKRIGNVVRKILGFEVKRLGDQNVSTVILDGCEEKLAELYQYYGIPYLLNG